MNANLLKKGRSRDTYIGWLGLITEQLNLMQDK